MSKSSAAALSAARKSREEAKAAAHEVLEKVSHPETVQADGDHAQDKHKLRVPKRALMWGFVQTTEPGVKRAAEPTARDALLWFDQVSHRFLIEVEKIVIDALSPLQFIQFVRELRDIETRVLYKYERKLDGTIGAPRRVWSR